MSSREIMYWSLPAEMTPVVDAQPAKIRDVAHYARTKFTPEGDVNVAMAMYDSSRTKPVTFKNSFRAYQQESS